MNSIQFLMTWRHFKKNWFYVSANILSLSIAFSVMTIAFFNLNFNRHFNRFFENGQMVYKVNTMLEIAQETHENSRSPIALADYINADERLVAGRFQYEEVGVRKRDALISQSAGYVDPHFLNLVPMTLSSGEAAVLEKGEKSVLLTEALSLKLFDGSNPVGGKVDLVINGHRQSFSIKGVIKRLPQNISFQFDLLLPFDVYLQAYGHSSSDWEQWVDATFVGGRDQSTIEKSLRSFLPIQNNHNEGKEATAYQLHSLWSWPSTVSHVRDNVFQGVLHPASVVGTVSSAFFVLLLACINFINTNLTLVGKRVKEVALKKTLGAGKRQFGWQLFLENLSYLICSLMLAIGISYFLFPEYNAMFYFQIVDFHQDNLVLLVAFLATVIFLVLAIVILVPLRQLSQFSTVDIFRGSWKQSSRKFLPFLLVLQFAVSTYNLFSLIVFAENDRYQQNLDNGFEMNGIVNLPITSEADHLKLVSALSPLTNVEQVQFSLDLVGFGYDNREVMIDGVAQSVASLDLGADYAQQVGLRLVKGRFYRNEERKKVVLINQLMADQIGLNPMAKRLRYQDQYYDIVGIVGDFNLQSIMLNNKRQPLVVFPARKGSPAFTTVSFRGGDRKGQEDVIRRVWATHFPDRLYAGFFQEDAVLPLKETNHIILRINAFVAIATLIMSLVGFYSAISLAVQRKLKELGVRKVLGADIWQIAYHLNKPFINVLWISSVLGLTGGYFFITSLLDIIYAYHIDISVKHFVWPLSLLLAMVIASSGFKLTGAILENPVNHLKSE